MSYLILKQLVVLVLWVNLGIRLLVMWQINPENKERQKIVRLKTFDHGQVIYHEGDPRYYHFRPYPLYIMQTIWRSYVPAYSGADPNWYTKRYTRDHRLYHSDPDIRDLRGYYLRKCDHPYDGWKEHRLILDKYNGMDELNNAGLKAYIDILNAHGYTVIFNADQNKSKPEIRHGHALKWFSRESHLLS